MRQHNKTIGRTLEQVLHKRDYPKQCSFPLVIGEMHTQTTMNAIYIPNMKPPKC